MTPEHESSDPATHDDAPTNEDTAAPDATSAVTTAIVPSSGTEHPDDWIITSSLLNILWGDLFGRIVPTIWAGGPAPYPIDEYVAAHSPGPVKLDPYHDAIRGYLKAYIDFFLHAGGGGKPITDPAEFTKRMKALNKALGKKGAFKVPVTLDKKYFEPRVSKKFKARLKILHRYLENGASVVTTGGVETQLDPIPVSFLACEDAFDFALGDTGLDLFYPQSPLRYGSQDELQEVYRAYGYRLTGRRPIAVPLGTEASDPRYQVTVNLSVPDGPSRIQVQAGGAHRWLQAQNQHVDPAWLARLVKGGVDIDALIVVRRSTNSWQLKGATYRRVLAELPRYIAEMWEDDGPQSAYRKAYVNNDDSGLRDIYETRLEIGLPTNQGMVFRGRDPAYPWDWKNGASTDPNRTAQDTLVTDRGLLFPEVDKAPDKEALLKSWIDGTAGNPMFTDSVQTA